MATKNHKHDPTEAWWDILFLSPHSSLRDIHQAYETLRMSYLPIKRDRSIPLSPETTEQLQKLDRAFRLALDSKKPSATPSNKSSSKASTKATPPAQTSKMDPFHSVVQDWAKTAAQSTSGATTDSSAKAQSQAPSPTTTTPTQSTKPAKKKSTANNTKASKKSSSGYWLLIFFVVCGIGGYLLGSDSKPASSKANGNSVSAPPPRAAPNNAPAQAPPPQYNPAPTVAEPLVAALQQELNRRGFNAGVVDGLRGPQTSGAISAAQSSFNMYIDGLPSEALLKALRRN